METDAALAQQIDALVNNLKVDHLRCSAVCLPELGGAHKAQVMAQ